MKKTIGLLLTVVSLLSLSCSKKVEEKEVELVMAEVNPEESLAGRMGKVFKEKVEELSEGKIKISLHCGGALGDTDEIMSFMTRPNSPVHICRQSVAGLAAFGCGKTQLLSIPYTFSGHEHFWKFVNSPTAKKFLAEPQERGLNIKGLYFGEEGFRHFCSSHPIKEIKDFKGLVFRTTQATILQDMADSFGCTYKVVPFTDMYAALQVGTVDVADQPLANYLSGNYYAVAPHLIMDGHQLAAMETVITTEAWDSLSLNQQNILIEAGKYASEFCHKTVLAEEEDYLKILREHGVVITEVEDITPWQELCKEIIARDSSKHPELYKEILSYAK